MAYKLHVTQAADRDLDDIVQYIAVQLANPEAAGSFLDEVASCYARLKQNPSIYALCQDGQFRRDGYRKVAIKNFVLLYRIHEESQIVEVMDFFYGAQNYLDKL